MLLVSLGCDTGQRNNVGFFLQGNSERFTRHVCVLNSCYTSRERGGKQLTSGGRHGHIEEQNTKSARALAIQHQTCEDSGDGGLQAR